MNPTPTPKGSKCYNELAGNKDVWCPLPCCAKVSQKIEEKVKEVFEDGSLKNLYPYEGSGGSRKEIMEAFRAALTDIWNSAIVEAGKVVDDFGCKEPRCEDGHYPLGVNEDDSVEWGGCPNCTKDGARLEPFAALAQSRTAINNLLIK